MVIVEKDKCVGCGLCAKIRHEQCIQLLNRNNHVEGKRMPVIWAGERSFG